MSEFPVAWLAGLQGGLLIGLAAALLFGLVGRIAGISGLLAGALRIGAPESLVARAFVAGLLVAGVIAALTMGPAPGMLPGIGLPTLIVAGLLVGFGTRLGNGCTSGHGVCGISRLSWRSLVATMTFMTAGFVTVFVIRHGGL
ncbi:MAG: YeeE/YedE family protein [Pseudomonadota bacterium]